MAIRLTESRLRKIIREEINEIFVSPLGKKFVDAPPVPAPGARPPSGTSRASWEALMEPMQQAVEFGEVDPYDHDSIATWLRTLPGYDKFSDYNIAQITGDLHDNY